MTITNPAELTEAAIRQLTETWKDIEEYAFEIQYAPWAAEYYNISNTFLYVWREDLLQLYHTMLNILAIWICYVFPALILENEEGLFLCQVPGSHSSAPPDCQSCFYNAGDWEEWHVVGWRLSHVCQSN
jgi:hypothetical protein